AIVFTMANLPYAREGDGLGQLFHDNQHRKNCWAATATLVISGFIVDFFITVLAIATIAIVTFGFGMLCKRLIDGFTGDTLGALCEITETVVAIMLAVFLTH
ncbi:MAG: adenosylcobinamide-GDP ribazoletransferase, partial [Desulfocapsaceae bacterium]|nr:adenosylcobinamide-GDP ribazoletransferase [Desulfocapsaceae bacterium]